LPTYDKESGWTGDGCRCDDDDWKCYDGNNVKCTKYCTGTGECGTCEPKCGLDDFGCCADSDCSSPTSYCDLDTHTCVECLQDSHCPVSKPNCYSDHTCYRCIDDTDCLEDGFYCNVNIIEERNWYCEPGPGDCDYTLDSSEDCDDYDDDWYCDDDVRKKWDWSCDDSNLPTSVECYKETLTGSEDCDDYDDWYCPEGTDKHQQRDYYCSGEPNANCDSYDKLNENTCRFGCKSGTDGCVPGVYCMERTCSYEEEQWCGIWLRCYTYDECTTTAGCYREDQPAKCYYYNDMEMRCGDWTWCSGCSCWWISVGTCWANCYYMDECYYA